MDTISVIGLVLGSSVLTGIITSYFNRRKIAGEALSATGSGIQKIVTSSIDLVGQYRAEMEVRWGEVRELRAEIRRLEKRLDEEVEKRLQAEAFKIILEEKSIEQGKQIAKLQQELEEFKHEILD